MMAARRPACVLLAEDNDALRTLLAAILRKNGFEVIEARDGEELLVALNRRTDVIVSDIRMPGCTGLEVLAALRRTNRTTPVILMTAFGSDETREEAIRLGADTILSKPLDPESLVTMVRSFSPDGA